MTDQLEGEQLGEVRRMEIEDSLQFPKPKKQPALKFLFGDLPERHDKMFLMLLGTQYFSQGTKVLVGLATANLYKEYYGLDPGYVQVLSTFSGIPWSFKIFYGLISDNVPLFGSRRRSYLILLSILQVIATLSLAFYFGNNEKWAAFLLCCINLSVAAMDVIVDSIMVIQSRQYPEDGSEQLQAFSWNCLAFGGIVGSLAGGILT
jgi:MFS family permease